MRRAHLFPLVLLLVAAVACGTGDAGADAAGGAPVAPLSLPTPPGPEGTAPDAGGGLAAKLTPAPTPEYLRQVGERTRLIATGRVKMVAAAVGGRGHEGTTDLSVLEGRWDNGAGRSRLRLDPTGALHNGATGLTALLGGPIEMIQVGATQYLQLGSSTAKWTKIDGGRDTSAVRTVFDLFKIADVSGFIGALACAAPVQGAGTEPIDGVATNHFRIEAASAKIKGCIARDDNAGGLLSNLGDSQRATVDVWVDDAGLVRRLVVTADEGALGAGLAQRFAGSTSVMAMTLSGFGEPAGIDVPPADQVADGSELGGLGALLGGGTGGTGGDTGDIDLGDLLSGLS
jgi:hypothetical protein